MITNDEEFREVFKEYLKSKDVKMNDKSYRRLCKNLNCEDCAMKDVKDGLYNNCLSLCEENPFQEIDRCKERIRLLKQEIDIMWNWKRNRKIENKLNDFCKTFRSGISLNNLTCRGIDCDKCLFKDMDNFKEWARQTKEKGEVKRDDCK